MPGTCHNPNTTNLCNVSVGESNTKQNPVGIPGFCSSMGGVGDNKREEYCSRMSSNGEWEFNGGKENHCQFNGSNYYQEITGCCCCNGGCKIAGGRGAECSRRKFTGDPLTCCFNDMVCTSNNPSSNPSVCYSDFGKQRTCSDGKNGESNHRSIVSTDCRKMMLQYCSGTLPGDDPESTEWMNRWTNETGTRSCANLVARNIYKQNNEGQCNTPILPPTGICNIEPSFEIDTEGFYWSQELVSEVLTKYERQGFSIGMLPGSKGYNPFQNFLYDNICCPFPGLCQQGLSQICATKTAQRISLNPLLSNWCGCHLPIGEYQDYSVRFNIPTQCTPMCNRFGTIPITGINSLPVNCKQDVCMIDNLTVNLINSQAGGGININQICGNCEGANCSCIIDNTTIDISNTIIGNNIIPINQICGSMTCSQLNSGLTGPTTINVPCGQTGFNPYEEYDEQVRNAQAVAKRNSYVVTMIIVGITLLLIFLLIIFINPNLYPIEGKIEPI